MTSQNKKKRVSGHNRITGETRLHPNLNEQEREASIPVHTAEQSSADSLRRIVNLPFQKWQWAVLGLISIAFFVIYYLTTARSVPPGDSAELISAAWNLGVPHQPGYPLLMMLSHLAGLIPIGTPAFRMNLLSAVLDALALGVLSFGIWRLLSLKSTAGATKFEKLVPLISLIGGAGFLGLSTAYWQYSGQAEVFALNNLLSALLIVLMLEWQRQPERIWLLRLSGLCTGLALTNQLTVVLLAPGLITLLIAGIIKYNREPGTDSPDKKRSGKNPGTGWLVRNLGITVALTLVGLLPYLYLLLAARTDPPINIGDPSTLNNFWRVVTRADYGTFILSPGGAKGNLII